MLLQLTQEAVWREVGCLWGLGVTISMRLRVEKIVCDVVDVHGGIILVLLEDVVSVAELWLYLVTLLEHARLLRCSVELGHLQQLWLRLSDYLLHGWWIFSGSFFWSLVHFWILHGR